MFIEESISTEIRSSCDVLVCGGGFGGISAALAAAREGKNVLLLERNYMLGGLGTAGLVTIYLPLCDGYGRQVSFGIVEELLRLSVSLGHEGRYPRHFLFGEGSRTEKDPRYEASYNPQFFAILAEQLLQKEGVKILYGTYAVAVHKEADRIDAVIVENKSGRYAIGAKTVVDATGDADIAHFAGAPTENFKQGNVLAGWYYGYSPEKGYKLKMVGASDIPDADKKPGHQTKMLVNRRFTGLDGEEISEMMQLSHAATMNNVMQRREKEGPELVPATIASIPQLRMTRRIAGEYELDAAEMHKHFDDSIGMVSDWRKRGPVYEVPFRTLYSAACPNLIMAGRCTSVSEPMWDIMRVIPCCAVTGQAAGIAAAMTDDFASLDVAELQKRLLARGVVLHEEDLPKIRPVAEADISACTTVIRTAFSTVAKQFGFTPENAPRFTAFAVTDDRLKHQMHENRPMFLWEQSGEVLGYCSLEIKEDGICELNNLGVLPAFRHRGIGAHLLHHAISEAKSRGCTKMHIGIVEENVLLRRWYERYGFVHTGTQKFDFFPFTCGYMERTL